MILVYYTSITQVCEVYVLHTKTMHLPALVGT